MSGTLIYAPDVRIVINTVKHGNVDVSGDILNGNLQLRGDGQGMHRLNFTLANPRRRYDSIFMPDDAISVQLKRLTWLQIFTGYLNTVPFFSIYPRNVSLAASCSFKKLQFWNWDIGSAAAFALMQDATPSTSPTDLQLNMTERVKALLTDVTEWPSEKIHIGGIPTKWGEKLADLRTELGPKVDWTGATDQILGGSASLGGQDTGTTGGSSGASGTNYGGAPTTPVDGNGEGYLPWVRGVATHYGQSYDAGGSQAGAHSALGVNVGTNPADGSRIGFGDYFNGYWCAYRMTYVMANKTAVPPGSQYSFLNYWWTVQHYLAAADEKKAAAWWAKQKVLAIDLATGKACCLRITDWGPNAGDGRFLDLSYKAKSYLTNGKLDNPQMVLQFASADTPPGPFAISQDQLASLGKLPVNADGTAVTTGSSSGQPTTTGAGGAQEITTPSGMGTASGDFFYPVVGYSIADTSDTFNAPRSGGRLHAGVDIIVPTGTDIVACMAGTFLTKTNSLGGNVVHVTLPDGKWFYYAHMKDGSIPNHPDGYQVKAGEYIGQVDQTGDADASVAHLHFSINNPGSDPTGRYGGENPVMDPYTFLKSGFDGKGGATPLAAGSVPSAGDTGTQLSYGQAVPPGPTQEGQLYGGLRALINDTPILPYIQSLMAVTQRVCCSAPNGDFIAWFPDYFDMFGTTAKMQISSVETRDAGIDWNDETFVTHQFTSTATSLTPDAAVPTGSVDPALIVHTAGIATIEFPEIMETLFNVSAIPDDNLLAIFKNSKAMLKRFGARPAFDAIDNTSSASASDRAMRDFWFAVFLFAQRWTNQFSVNVPLMWMPEVFPGMHIQFTDAKVQLYVEGVTHSWDFEGGSFTTDVQAKCPSKTDGGGFFLPANSTKARVTPVTN